MPANQLATPLPLITLPPTHHPPTTFTPTLPPQTHHPPTLPPPSLPPSHHTHHPHSHPPTTHTTLTPPSHCPKREGPPQTRSRGPSLCPGVQHQQPGGWCASLPNMGNGALPYMGRGGYFTWSVCTSGQAGPSIYSSLHHLLHWDPPSSL